MEDGSKRLTPIKKHRRKYRSVIAAYVSGKLPLCQIMHPSRLTSKSRRQQRLNLHSDERKYLAKLNRVIPSRLKRPPLKDYIKGVVPLSAMLGAEKISDIPATRKMLNRIVEQQNFGTPDTLFSGRGRATASVRNTEKAKSMLEVSSKYSFSERSTQYKDTANTSKISDARLPSWTSRPESGCAQKIGGLDVSETPSTVAVESTMAHETGDMKPSILAGSEFDLRTAKECDGAIVEYGRPDKSKASRMLEHPSTQNRLTRRYSASMKLLEREYFLKMLKSHEYVEQRLIRQIIYLRKDRDRYRNAYHDLVKIHKILAERWLQFRQLSID